MIFAERRSVLPNIRTFQALRTRDFRLLWTGLTISAVGTWMQIVSQSLLVLQVTNGSAFALGTVSIAQASSFLIFALAGGGVADRHNKRKLMLTTQSAMMCLALLLGILTATGIVQFWMIAAIAFANGAALSFDQPARNALIAELVPKENLMNAISLQAAVFNGASLIGPALAGLAQSRIGYAGNFFLNAASYLAVITALLPLRHDATASLERRATLFESLREMFGRVRRDARLRVAILSYGALLWFGPSVALMLPLYTTQILHAGATNLGLLFSVVGAGTVMSAFATASLGDIRNKDRLLQLSILLWAASLTTFGLSDSIPFAIPALFLIGAAQTAAGTATITLLQTRVPPEMRGRAMSLYTLLIMFVRPLGDFPAGALVGAVGLRPVVVGAAAIVGVIALTRLSHRV